MRAAVCLCALMLVGCPPKAPLDTGGPAGPVHPDLKCPPGTVASGVAPPAGTEVWCTKPLADGTTVREGPSIQFHANTSKKAEGAFAQDKQSGPWLYWYPTGTPQMQGSFASGVREGVWTSYQANGERSSEGQYVDGKEHGMWTFWNADVFTRTEGEYVLGDRNGPWIDFGPDDRAVRERSYRNGRMISQREL